MNFELIARRDNMMVQIRDSMEPDAVDALVDCLRELAGDRELVLAIEDGVHAGHDAGARASVACFRQRIAYWKLGGGEASAALERLFARVGAAGEEPRRDTAFACVRIRAALGDGRHEDPGREIGGRDGAYAAPQPAGSVSAANRAASSVTHRSSTVPSDRTSQALSKPASR
ncbi:hypothetical protein [Arenibaculum pallidiluteum]|uniref:hypothetical protein n=1 Tax=Arenibaculum pallidiluteum TaxID=2812559 RepID=UPI001A978B2A|nr:hypothetical protein [Arenibaculum pallidiluteum]